MRNEHRAHQTIRPCCLRAWMRRDVIARVQTRRDPVLLPGATQCALGDPSHPDDSTQQTRGA